MIQKTTPEVSLLDQYKSMRKTAESALPSLLLGTAAGVALSAALLALTAMVFVKLKTPPAAAASLVTTAAGACGAFAAGYVTLRLFGSRGLLMGALSGLLMFCCVLAGGSASGGASLSPMLIKCAVFTVCGAAGGVVRVNKRAKLPKVK